MDVLSIINVLRILGESPEHHGLPWDVVAPAGQEVQSDLVEAREEVESEPGTLSGTSWPGVTWCTPGSDREGLDSVWLEKMVGVDGRTLIETSSVWKSPSVLVLHLAVDVR